MSLQQETGVAGSNATRRGRRIQPLLIAAYRQGLGLAAVAVSTGSGGVRIAAAAGGDSEDGVAGDSTPRFWCRRLSDAERVAAAATARLGRDQQRGAAAALAAACESIASAARRLNVSLRSDEEIRAEAAAVIARVEAETARLQRAGELKSINKSYRAYRIEASARGERVLRYADWISKYKEILVRELAAALKYV